MDLETYTVAQVAAILHCNIKTVYRAIKDGKLRTVRVGTDYRITRNALQEFLGESPCSKQPTAAK